MCDNRPVRQDVLDEVVWAEIIRLLEDPALIKEELESDVSLLQKTQLPPSAEKTR